MTGVEEFLHGLEKYCETPEYPSEFGAKVFKIARDDQGNRLSYMKITGGTLKVKELLTDTEKADQIRIYSGAKFELAKEAHSLPPPDLGRFGGTAKERAYQFSCSRTW